MKKRIRCCKIKGRKFSCYVIINAIYVSSKKYVESNTKIIENIHFYWLANISKNWSPQRTHTHKYTPPPSNPFYGYHSYLHRTPSSPIYCTERKSTCVEIEGVWDVLCISVIFSAFFSFFYFSVPFSFVRGACLPLKWKPHYYVYVCKRNATFF